MKVGGNRNQCSDNDYNHIFDVGCWLLAVGLLILMRRFVKKCFMIIWPRGVCCIAIVLGALIPALIYFNAKINAEMQRRDSLPKELIVLYDALHRSDDYLFKRRVLEEWLRMESTESIEMSDHDILIIRDAIFEGVESYRCAFSVWSDFAPLLYQHVKVDFK